MIQFSFVLRATQSIEEQVAPIRLMWETGVYRDLLLHVYSGLDDEAHTVGVARILRDVFPDAPIVGTMSAGEIADGRVTNKGVVIGVLLFESGRAHVRRYDDLRGREAEVARQVCADIAAIEDAKAVELLLPGTEVDGRTLIRGLSECPEDLVVFGGYSGGHTMNSPTHFVFDETGTMDDAMFVTVFAGGDLHVDAGKVTGWEPVGLTFKVTKASGNRLIELDGRPAAEVYERFLPIDRSRLDNAEEGYTFPLIAREGEEEWLRSTIHIEDDGSLQLHGHVTEGMDILLSYGNPESIVRAVDGRLEELREFGPQAILVYSCIVRKAFWETYAGIELEPFAALANATGFHTWGELFRSPLTGRISEHNVTFLTVGLREGERSVAAPATAAIVVDDTALHGPAAQLRRLTSMIYAVMGELHQAHEDLRALNAQLKNLAEHDALTGLYNRGRIEELILSALDDTVVSGETVGLIMLDIDHFKRVNDHFGHQAGDAVLQGVARVLRDMADEDGGVAGRWGGEEFFLVFPRRDTDEVARLAEVLRARVEASEFDFVGHVTCSLGYTSAMGPVDHRRLFASVDDALYRAKEGGRNQVVRAAY